jgi:Carboxypeptidase regulatory-like domain
MRNMIRKIGFVFLFGVLLAGVLAFGQITGDLQVNVSDQSNAGIPNATVTVRNVDTGATRNTATDATGQIRVSQLEPGRYEVKVALLLVSAPTLKLCKSLAAAVQLCPLR